MKNLLAALVLLFLTSCSYNIDNHVGGNVSANGNTIRNATPSIVTPYMTPIYYAPPFYAYRPWYRYW
jgi:hypothetical protein